MEIKTSTDLLREVYKVNIDACQQEIAIAEKYDDKDFLDRAKRSLSKWQEKLEALDKTEA